MRKKRIWFGALFVVFLALVGGSIWFLRDGPTYSPGGVWEDDPNNWERAFGAPVPEDVEVIHSWYWRTNRFTKEQIYFFEVAASDDWRGTYLEEHSFDPVPPEMVRTFRQTNHFPEIPSWFVPDPSEDYDAWDKPGRWGSVWVSRASGNIHFYGIEF